MPLIYVLYKMEKEGIKVDQKYLEQMGIEIDNKMKSLEQGIYEDAGIGFGSDRLFEKNDRRREHGKLV